MHAEAKLGPGAAQSTGKLGSEFGDNFRPGVERPVADDIADTPVEIDARRKTQVDTARAKLGGDQPACLPGKRKRVFRLGPELATDDPHGRDRRETVAKTLHPAAFVVNRDDERRAPERPNFIHQFRKLLRRLVVATEQDQSADGRFAQQVTISRREAETIDVEHHRSE